MRLLLLLTLLGCGRRWSRAEALAATSSIDSGMRDVMAGGLMIRLCSLQGWN